MPVLWGKLALVVVLLEYCVVDVRELAALVGGVECDVVKDGVRPARNVPGVR